MTFEEVGRAVADAGFSVRGGFHPEVGDEVPGLALGAPVLTLVLVGNVGPTMWQRFRRECDSDIDLLDDWSRDRLTSCADCMGARALFPFTTPALPFQRWARRAESCHPSPIGIHIHPDHGLWHGYRGALAFTSRFDVPPPPPRASPCHVCLDKPCLITCPVDAFADRRYDVAACVRHLATSAGRDCMELGCRARRACRVGRAYMYEPAQAHFHMRAFLRRRRTDDEPA